MFLSLSTQRRLCELIMAIAEAEKRTEMVRQVLAEQNMFQPYTVFRRLDQLRTGELVVSDIMDFLADNALTATPQEAQYLFRRLDYNRDGRITYPEQFVFFGPLFPKALSNRSSRKRMLDCARQPRSGKATTSSQTCSFPTKLNGHQQKSSNKKFKITSIEGIFSRCQLQRTITKSQQQLISASDFNSLDAFRCIDVNYLGYITIERQQFERNFIPFLSLHMFIKSNNQAVSFDELSAFFRVVDADEDGRITYSELLEAVTFVPNYFGGSRQQPSSTIYSDLQRSREYLETVRLQEDLRRSREQLRENLRREGELHGEEQLRRSRERLEDFRQSNDRIEELRRSREYLRQLQRSRERVEELRSSREREEALRRSRERVEDLRRSREQVDELRRRREQERLEELRRNEQVLWDLRRSREKLNELRRSREVMEEVHRSREREDELRRSRDLLGNLRRSREREEELRRSRDFLDGLRRSRDQVEDLRRSRELLEDLRRSREKVVELRRSRELLSNRDDLLLDQYVRRSRERDEQLYSLRRQTEEAKPSQGDLRRSRERQEEMRKNDRQLQQTDLQRSRERLEEIKRSREKLEQLDQYRTQQGNPSRLQSEIAPVTKSRLYNASKRPFQQS